MPSPTLPLWFQRLPAELARRLERAEAAAREARNETHAAQALELVAILAPRLPFDEAVDRYIEIMGLTGDEAEIVRTRALVLLSDPEVEDKLAGERAPGLELRLALCDSARCSAVHSSPSPSQCRGRFVDGARDRPGGGSPGAGTRRACARLRQTAR
jgi:hypothetical protein